MAHISDLIATDINEYLKSHEHKSLLRFITCGSVDDGKSTLIGRLLYDSKMIFEDQLAAIEADSKKMGTQGGKLDLALLVDGLAAEREQGITIDVAYRFFSTDKRKFIVADTPGHEQYTRNMVTGASTASLAVILIDATKGILIQTRRHSYLVSLIGIRHVVLAINKMDMVGFAQDVFESILKDYREFAKLVGLESIVAIPISALNGDNITERSAKTPWYTGPTLMGHLETVQIDDDRQSAPFRLPVQWVNRPNMSFRGFSGLIASGTVHPGDRLRVLPSGKESRVARIIGTPRGEVLRTPGIDPKGSEYLTLGLADDLDEAVADQAVTIVLEDEIDVSRGDVLARADAPPAVADRFQVTIIWMAEEPMLPGRQYWVKIGAKLALATVLDLRHKTNVNTLEQIEARKLELNEIGACHLSLDQPIAFDPYVENRDTGGFILIDRMTNGTVGAGLIQSALRRAENIHWQAIEINKQAHATIKNQKACILWFTGLSGAGKSTIANLVEKRLYSLGHHTFLLDGDNVRHGLNRDLGFTNEDRVENIRRVAEVAKLMVDAGLITLVSFISPFRSERRMARELMEVGEFIEVYVNTPLEVAEARDRKGLYKKARAGEIKNFTGIDSAYEPPENAEIVVNTSEETAEQAADRIVRYLSERDSIREVGMDFSI